jgi:hypothetical protein
MERGKSRTHRVEDPQDKGRGKTRRCAMLKSLKMVFVVASLVLFVGPAFAQTVDTAWVRRYDGPGNADDIGYAVAVDTLGSVYVTGGCKDSEMYNDFTTIKYLANGDTAWVRTYNGPGDGHDQALAIAVDDSGYIAVTGFSLGIGTDLDYATVRYYPNGDTVWARRYNGTGDSGDGEVKDETGSRERPSEFDLSQNYPNPFNPTTKIEFTLSKPGFVSLDIYDVLGRRVRTLVSEELSSGYKSVIWDGKNDDGESVASGVYFYQLKVGDFSEPKKMLLLK